PPAAFVHFRPRGTTVLSYSIRRKAACQFTLPGVPLAVRPRSSIARDGESGRSCVLDITLGPSSNLRSMLPSLAFFIAAFVLAVTPGPGIAYVVARTAAGGRAEGLASCIGTGLGGMFHVCAAALGLSVLLAQSAGAFTV